MQGYLSWPIIHTRSLINHTKNAYAQTPFVSDEVGIREGWWYNIEHKYKDEDDEKIYITGD